MFPTIYVSKVEINWLDNQQLFRDAIPKASPQLDSDFEKQNVTLIGLSVTKK